MVFDPLGRKPWWFHAFIGDVGFKVRVTAWMRFSSGESSDNNRDALSAAKPVV